MEPDRATQSPLCRGQTFQFFFNIISSLCFRKGNSVCIQRSIGCTYFCNMTVFAVAYKCEETENPQVPWEVFSEGDNDLKKHYAETNKHELTYTRDSLPLMDKLPDKSWHLLTPRHSFQSLMKMPQTKVAFQVALATLPLVYQFSDRVTACFFLFITDGQDPVNICPDTPHQMFSTSDENVNFYTREGTTVRENWICFFCFSVSLYSKLPNKFLCVCVRVRVRVQLVILTSLQDHSVAKQLQRTAEQTHYSGSLLLTHTHTHILKTQQWPAVTSEYEMTCYTLPGRVQRVREVNKTARYGEPEGILW